MPNQNLQDTLLNNSFDIVIVGGGMVGASLAAGFAQQNKSVLVIERARPENDWLSQPPLRVSAVNRYSETWLQSVGCWNDIDKADKCQFNRLATWEKGTDKVEFSAEELQESHLGHLIRNEALQLACYSALEKNDSDKVSFMYGGQIDQVQNNTNNVIITGRTKDDKAFTVNTLLLVGADGANSKVRQLAKIGVTGWDYQQACFSITIKTNFATQDITWQEFQPSGPKAFLPLNDGFASLIWYDSKSTITALKGLSDQALKQAIIETFPELPGDFDIIQHASFPLTRRQANQYNNGRIVLVGDAAHTINPLAGQGVNLGYKDNATLLSLMQDSDLKDFDRLVKLLKRYTIKRKADSLLMSGVMDGFYHLFSNDKAPLKKARGLMLSLANHFSFAKKSVIKKALGF